MKYLITLIILFQILMSNYYTNNIISENFYTNKLTSQKIIINKKTYLAFDLYNANVLAARLKLFNAFFKPWDDCIYDYQMKIINEVHAENLDLEFNLKNEKRKKIRNTLILGGIIILETVILGKIVIKNIVK